MKWVRLETLGRDGKMIMRAKWGIMGKFILLGEKIRVFNNLKDPMKLIFCCR